MTEPLRFPPTVERWLAEAAADPEAFWGRAAEALPWFRRWDRVFEPDPPSFRWFVGGRTNLAHDALDRHVAAGDGERLALIAVNERGERRDLTYRGLLGEVERVAAALRGHRLQRHLPDQPGRRRRRRGQLQRHRHRPRSGRRPGRLGAGRPEPGHRVTSGVR